MEKSKFDEEQTFKKVEAGVRGAEMCRNCGT